MNNNNANSRKLNTYAARQYPGRRFAKELENAAGKKLRAANTRAPRPSAPYDHANNGHSSNHNWLTGRVGPAANAAHRRRMREAKNFMGKQDGGSRKINRRKSKRYSRRR